MSSLVISAIRSSRSDFAAAETAFFAASSQEQKSKNLEIAKRYVLEERKRQLEKKQDAEKKTRAALDTEASQRAQEAADLKAMLGQKGANAPKPEDI